MVDQIDLEDDESWLGSRKRVHDEILYLHEARLTDIRQWKAEQWRYGYTALIALTGLFVSFHAPATPPERWYRLLVIIACVLIAFFWWRANRSTDDWLARSRAARNKTREFFSEEARSTFIEDPKKSGDLKVISRTLTWAVMGESAFVIVAAILRS